jgi:PIN domain nuclease of toxin-antitoxin system
MRSSGSLMAASIESVHRDPFDRMLAAQARVEGLTLVTTDPAFATLGAATLW